MIGLRCSGSKINPQNLAIQGPLSYPGAVIARPEVGNAVFA